MNNKKNQTYIKNSFPYLILIVVVVGTLLLLNFSGNKVNELTTGELIKEIEKGSITEITLTDFILILLIFVFGVYRLMPIKTQPFPARSQKLSRTSFLTKNNEL